MVLLPAPNCEGNDLELELLVTKSFAQLTPSTSEAKVAHESPDGSILAEQSNVPSPDEQVYGASNYYYCCRQGPQLSAHEHAVVLGMGLKEA